MPSADDELPPSRAWEPSSTDEVYSVPRRRRVGGWIVAFVLVLAAGIGVWVIAKSQFVARSADSTSQLDPRAQGFVMEGEKALADGDLELSQQDFDKASFLAERDPRVLLDEARVAAAKADVSWMALRLLPATATDEIRANRAQLADRQPRLRKAADEALAAAPDDPAAVRSKVDALRLVGDRDAARSYVSKITPQASQPETSYVLAALDLAETTPIWSTVIDRLRLAAAGEGNAGRARAALVYALARSGDVTAAKAELAKLDALTRPYPLLPLLHAFVGKAPASPTADGGVSEVPHVDVNTLPTQSMPVANVAGAGDSPTGELTAGGMQAASQAIRKGDWARARQVYEGMVARNPRDSEALSGLGDVERATGSPSGAISAYRRALGVNPSYLPALLGVADTEWATGDHGSAQRAYKDIEDRFPEGTYPPYVKARAEPPSAPTNAPSSASPPTETEPPAPSAGTPAAPKPAASSDRDGL